MAPGYSRLILNESVIPDIDCPAFFAAGDINMMSILAGIKRSCSQWIELLRSVGFEEVHVSTSPYSGDEEGVIEVMLPTERDTVVIDDEGKDTSTLPMLGSRVCGMAKPWNNKCMQE